ncbi:hypothetical protein AABB24_027040, partial [Solanum stoloniferum]
VLFKFSRSSKCELRMPSGNKKKSNSYVILTTPNFPFNYTLTLSHHFLKFHHNNHTLRHSLSHNQPPQIMARGSSSQSTSTSTTRPGTAAPRGSAAATAGMRRRRLGASSSAGGGGGNSVVGSGNASNMLRFYTDDSPGLKISPTVVLVMSLCFIGFVATLHVLGKFYRYRSGSGSGSGA